MQKKHSARNVLWGNDANATQEIAITPILLENFEFCKKHCFSNLSGLLNVKFQAKKFITDFIKKYFHFSQIQRSFQGQGHFRF